MDSAIENFELSDASFEDVMKPYTSQPDSPVRRRQRRWTTISLCIFCLFYGFMFAFFVPVFIVIFLVPLAVLSIVCIWALPEARPPTRLLSVLFVAFLVTKVIWPDYLAISLPGVPWITLVRIVAAPMTLVFLISISVSQGFRNDLKNSLREERVIAWLLAAFVLIQVITMPMSKQLSFSLSRFINAQFEWIATFFIACWFFLKSGRAERWITIFAALTIPISLVAVLEFRMGHVPWAGHIPGFLKIEDPSVQITLAGTARASTGRYRAESTFTTPLGFAEYLALATPFVLHILFKDFPRFLRVSAAITLPLICLASWLTNARLGSIGLLVGVAAYALFWAINRLRSNRRDVLASILVRSYPVLFICLMATSLVIGRLRRAIWGGGETQTSTEARHVQFQTGIPMILKNPFGHGIGEAANVLGFHQPNGLLTIDSYYLSVGLEYGLLGFAAYYGLFAWSAYRAARVGLDLSPKDRELTLLLPASVSLLVYIMIKAVFSEESNNSFAFILLGMVAALIYRVKSAGKRTAPILEASHVTANGPGGAARSHLARKRIAASRIIS